MKLKADGIIRFGYKYLMRERRSQTGSLMKTNCSLYSHLQDYCCWQWIRSPNVVEWLSMKWDTKKRSRLVHGFSVRCSRLTSWINKDVQDAAALSRNEIIQMSTVKFRLIMKNELQVHVKRVEAGGEKKLEANMPKQFVCRHKTFSRHSLPIHSFLFGEALQVESHSSWGKIELRCLS